MLNDAFFFLQVRAVLLVKLLSGKKNKNKKTLDACKVIKNVDSTFGKCIIYHHLMVDLWVRFFNCHIV